MRLSGKVYKKVKEHFMVGLNINESEYVEMIKGDYHEGASRASSASIAGLLVGKKDSTGPIVFSNELGDDFDFLWFYKRNLHVVLPEIESIVYDSDGVDCTALKSLDKDIDIDTVLPSLLGPQVSFVRVIKRNIPIWFGNNSCDCTIEVIHEDDSKLRFHFTMSDKVRKVFIESIRWCTANKCNACKHINCNKGVEHVLRPRFRDGCAIRNYFCEPLVLVCIANTIAETYLNREKLSRARKPTAASESLKRIMIAHDDNDEDRERVIPLYEYVKEYHESEKYEWKGGHHASPVSHPRSGYWRKARHGTHILKDGKFIEVGRGLGKYIYVKPTVVNAHKDSVLSDML